MKRRVLVVFVLVIALFATACSNKVDDSQVGTSVEDEMDVSEDTPSTEEQDEVEETEEVEEVEEAKDEDDSEESISWPADFLDNVPAFESGEVHRTRSDNENHVFIGFKSVDHEDAVKYVEQVKEAGFTKDSAEYVADYTVNFKGNDKDGNFVKVHWTSDNYLAIDMTRPEK